MSENVWRRIAERRAALDARRPLAPELLARLEAWYEVELTYSSNAIEGNTLTRSETAIVLEKGLTVRGKPLRDHMEATDHRDALRFVRELAARDVAPPTRSTCARSTASSWARPAARPPGDTASSRGSSPARARPFLSLQPCRR